MLENVPKRGEAPAKAIGKIAEGVFWGGAFVGGPRVCRKTGPEEKRRKKKEKKRCLPFSSPKQEKRRSGHVC